jgi:hypothetical protein
MALVELEVHPQGLKSGCDLFSNVVEFNFLLDFFLIFFGQQISSIEGLQ